MSRKILLILAIFKHLLLGFILALSLSFSVVYAQDVEVEVEIAPKQDLIPDRTAINGCFWTYWSDTFPLDFFYQDPQLQDNDNCPNLWIFDNQFEMCYLNDIYDGIEPGVKIGLFIYAIFNL